MASNTARAGGCFLTVCILAGTVAGIILGNPMKGVLIGTGTGAALAVLLWLIDLRRS
jgi:mannose/fructose/N-acetylgalactosamine-specific phosphotransferase system component IIC